jgi:hypothetical protein
MEKFRDGLVEGGPVKLDIGSDCEVLDCKILGFVGPAMLLLPRTPPSFQAVRKLGAGSNAAELLVEAGAYVHALRGTAMATGNTIVVQITEQLRLSQRRWYSRAKVCLDARLVPQGGGPAPTDTTTADVSAGGVQVHRPATMPVWPRYELTLSGDLLAAEIVAEAVPARVQANFLGLRFTRIEPRARQVLTELVLRELGGASGIAA